MFLVKLRQGNQAPSGAARPSGEGIQDHMPLLMELSHLLWRMMFAGQCLSQFSPLVRPFSSIRRQAELHVREWPALRVRDSKDEAPVSQVVGDFQQDGRCASRQADRDNVPVQKRGPLDRKSVV